MLLSRYVTQALACQGAVPQQCLLTSSSPQIWEASTPVHVTDEGSHKGALWQTLLAVYKNQFLFFLDTQLDYLSQPPLQLVWPCDWVLVDRRWTEVICATFCLGPYKSSHTLLLSLSAAGMVPWKPLRKHQSLEWLHGAGISTHHNHRHHPAELDSPQTILWVRNKCPSVESLHVWVCLLPQPTLAI